MQRHASGHSIVLGGSVLKLTTPLRLVWLHNKQSLIRLRYDFGREVVVIISAITLLGLFFYIFHDFLHQKVRDIPEPIRERLIAGFLVSLLLLLGPWIGGRIRRLWSEDAGWSTYTERLGENPRMLAAFRILQSCLVIGASYALYWLWLLPAFTSKPLAQGWLWQVLSLGLGAARAWWLQPSAPDRRLQLEPILDDREISRVRTLILWRWHQLTRRNRLSRLCLGLALVLQLAAIGLGAWAWPFFLIILLSMLSSLLLASAAAFQLEEDMRAIWFERQMGCSHDEYVRVYQYLCWGLGAAMGLLALTGTLVFRKPEVLPLAEAWKILPIAALFPSILPSIMFQLAPDRPLLQILVTALIGLFLGTAIYAHGLALFLVPLFTHYAKHYQSDNFYRT
jgi:hypothetical protein